MNRFKLHVSTLALAAMLAGCGHGAVPMAASVHANTFAAASAKANNRASSLITRFKAIQGFDTAAMAKRDAIVASLGKTDSDQAVQFLMDEHDALTQYPTAVRKTFQKAILNAMIALDDAAFVPTGAAEGEVPLTGEEAQIEAAAHHSRHMSFIHWATTPLRWLDEGIRWFLGVVNGHHGGKKPKPAPAPAGGPSGGSDPSSGGSDPSSAGGSSSGGGSAPAPAPAPAG